jgi:hypothetical protein
MAARLSARRTRRTLLPRSFLVLISVKGWVNPREIVRLDGIKKWKKIQWPHPDSKPILIIYLHVRHGLPSVLFPLGFATKILTSFSFHRVTLCYSILFERPHDILWWVGLNNREELKFLALKKMGMKIIVFWVLTPCSLVELYRLSWRWKQLPPLKHWSISTRQQTTVIV